MGDPTFEHHGEAPVVAPAQPPAVQDPGQAPGRGRNPLERAILVPVGAALLAAEELLGIATALVNAEKAGRELLHFEERGVRARSHVEGLVHHHRHRVADNLEQRIEQTRTQVNGLATKSHSITSKIRPHMPKY